MAVGEPANFHDDLREVKQKPWRESTRRSSQRELGTGQISQQRSEWLRIPRFCILWISFHCITTEPEFRFVRVTGTLYTQLLTPVQKGR